MMNIQSRGRTARGIDAPPLAPSNAGSEFNEDVIPTDLVCITLSERRLQLLITAPGTHRLAYPDASCVARRKSTCMMEG